MKKLVDLLAQRSLYDLLQKAKQFSVEGPDSLSEEEWQSVLDFTEASKWSDKKDHLDYYLELAEEEDSFWEVDEDEYDDPGERARVEEYRRKDKRLAKSIQTADEVRAVIEERVAGKLLDKSVMEEYLLEAGDKTIEILKDISTRQKDSGDGKDVYSLSIPWRDCIAADILETWGYAVVRSTEAWKNEDEHRHVTGIIVPEDVIGLFMEVFTDELDDSRKNRYAVFECCNLAKMYYETAPLEIVMEIYHRYAESVSIKKILMEVCLFCWGNTRVRSCRVD